MWELDQRSLSTEKLMLSNCGAREDSWESLGLQDQSNQPKRKSIQKGNLNIPWKDWCWSWNCNSLVTWGEELTHWKRPWCWERLKVGGEGDDRGWDCWMASLTRWAWVWVSSGNWDGQESMVCCSPWGCKELDMTERLSWTDSIRFGISSLGLPRVSGRLSFLNCNRVILEWFFFKLFQGLNENLCLCSKFCHI